MKSRLLTIIAVLCTAVLGAWAAGEVPAMQNVFGRQGALSLNGMWSYIVDVQENGYYGYHMEVLPWGFQNGAKAQSPSALIEYDFDKSPKMRVPGDWNTQDERLLFYEGTVWLHRYFDYHAQAGRRAVLYFGAVNYQCIVFVNGKKVGEHEGGYTPFCFDVTDVLHEGGDNFIIVKVDNKRRVENVPTRVFDWWNYGGITRDVLLLSLPTTYIEDYAVGLKDRNPQMLTADIRLNEQRGGVPVTMEIPELRVKWKGTTDTQGRIAFSGKAKPVLWSPENPKRYRVVVTGGEESIEDSIAFRTIETRGQQILLNGKPVFLRGICIHEETLMSNRRANGREDAHRLLAVARELGCNYVRLAHYPHNEHAVREAERMGIMVWSEIPLYWSIAWENPDTYQNASRQLHDMIERDKNRACVIIWSLANETPHGEARDRFLSSLAREARQQDSTRLISMAMEVLSAQNYVNRLQDNMNEWVDVISFNQYVGWYRDVHDAPKMRWEIPYKKPIIISEFGGGAVAGRHGSKDERWTEEFLENLYTENLAMLDKIEGLAGTSPWCLKDFRSPRRPLAGVQDYFNRKGLVSDQGVKKNAFYVVQKWYEGKK